jgi:hypothetical protein
MTTRNPRTRSTIARETFVGLPGIAALYASYKGRPVGELLDVALDLSQPTTPIVARKRRTK